MWSFQGRYLYRCDYKDPYIPPLIRKESKGGVSSVSATSSSGHPLQIWEDWLRFRKDHVAAVTLWIAYLYKTCKFHILNYNIICCNVCILHLMFTSYLTEYVYGYPVSKCLGSFVYTYIQELHLNSCIYVYSGYIYMCVHIYICIYTHIFYTYI